MRRARIGMVRNYLTGNPMRIASAKARNDSALVGFAIKPDLSDA